jgi:hypothetical protein
VSQPHVGQPRFPLSNANNCLIWQFNQLGTHTANVCERGSVHLEIGE